VVQFGHGQIPFTRVWVAATLTGVPFGAQTAWLSWSSTGEPCERTRVAPRTQDAVTQGTGDPLTLKGQPVTLWGPAIVAIGWLLTRTRVLGTVGWA
jgi:hypothetical protein